MTAELPQATILAAAMVFDAMVGDPRWFWQRLIHPVTAFAAAITTLEQWLVGKGDRVEQLRPATAIALGAITALAPALVFPALTWAVLNALPPLAAAAAEALMCGILLCHQDLWQRVGYVRRHLARWEQIAKAAPPSAPQTANFLAADNPANPRHQPHTRRAAETELEQARDGLFHLAGRRRDNLTPAGIARAALECGAESLCDGVVAPVFWFAVGSMFGAGAEAMVAYKVVNTADSTIGYRSQRYRYFGRCAAYLDDCLNWLPARVCVVLIALAGMTITRPRAALAALTTSDGRASASPNAGHPQAALAHLLGVSLGGPIRYPSSGKNKGAKYADIWFNPKAPPPRAADIARCIALGWIIWSTLLMATILASLMQ